MTSKPKQPAQPTPSAIRSDAPVRPGVLVAIRLLAFVAMGISAYLSYVSMTGDRIVGCGPDSGCDHVLKSRWAYFLNIPVSMLALVVYSLILGASFRLSLKREPAVQRTTWAWLVGCAVLVLAAAVWFVGLQVFVVRAICPFCMTAHVCGALAGILILAKAPLRSPAAKPWELEKLVFVAPRTLRRAVIVALLALAVLIAGQVNYQRRTLVVKPIEGGTNVAASITSKTPAQTVASNPSPAPPIAASVTNTPAAATSTKRLVPIYSGQFQLDASEVPILGAPTNQHVIVSLFDYTCHHCRAMHPLLVEAQQMFSNRLAILSLPMPLDPGCNVTMTKAHPSHTNACAYARLGLAVWRADRRKHAEFDHWLMDGEKPPPLPEAQAKAAELVGLMKLDAAMAEGWTETQLKLNVAIYEVAYRAGRGQMPQLIVGSNVALGTYAKPELLQLLSDNLGLKPAP